MLYRYFCLTVAVLAILVAGCGDQVENNIGIFNRPIINGVPDTSQEHMAVVGVTSNFGMCTGTLIHDQIVMTAAHCIDDGGAASIYVAFDNSLDWGTDWKRVSAKVLHPGYDPDMNINDIGLLLLSQPQPAGIIPIPNLPGSLALEDPDDIDIPVEFVGFGQTETGGSGTKEHVTGTLTWICDHPQGCWINSSLGWYAVSNTICTNQEPGGPCYGDSGGPAFVWRGGQEYTAGVTSYGVYQDCTRFGCSTKVDKFESFILDFIGGVNGASCSSGGDCDSGICQDGVCCNTSCSGDCRFCNMSQALGTCTTAPNGYLCPDNDKCNGDETCQNGVCTDSPPADCDDHNMCTADTCTPSIGCRHTPETDGTSCSDGNICNGVETCQGGLCRRPDPLDCDDGDPCTSDSCDRNNGCIHPPIPDGSSCEDNNVCNGEGVCQGGVCIPGTALECDDNNSCTDDQCLPDSGCAYNPYPTGTPCNDGQVCTVNDSCVGGVCTGQAVDCDDNNLCTEDVCDQVGGCQHTQLADGTSCGGGQCGQGVCVQGECEVVDGPSCEDYEPCTNDWCDPQQGCMHERLPDGWECGECYMCLGGQCMKATNCGKSGGCSSAGGPGGPSLLGGLLLLVLWGRRRLR
jgi:hypothetical protein